MCSDIEYYDNMRDGGEDVLVTRPARCGAASVNIDGLDALAVTLPLTVMTIDSGLTPSYHLDSEL